ncbi:MAG: hypothetical protein DLM59_13075 [Pseudonocardiales bacterium]|nr:MAG: hypothetical protein DLM59_13075 [Pseudonocardiales bacterium]
MPGLVVTPRAGGVRGVFDQGLFAGSDHLTPTGAALLARLGRRMAGRGLSVTVTGHVVAVPGGRTSGGSVVALARALVAAQVLARSSAMPLTPFTLLSADQTQGPFPDPARNRTVTLLVVP